MSGAVFEAGYGSVRGFYEQAGLRLGVEPSRYAAGGVGEQLLWSTAKGLVGVVLVVVSRRGVIAARVGSDERALLAEVAAELPRALLVRDDALREVMAVVTRLASGNAVTASLPLDVRGTAFQTAVWAVLRTIPTGETRSYGEVAAMLSQPTAVRAVARACAANPVALVVPCHRVIRGDGGLGGFRWGLRVKAALLAAEGAAASTRASA